MTVPSEPQILSSPATLILQSRVRPIFRQAPAVAAIGTVFAVLAPAFIHDPASLFMVFALWVGLVAAMGTYIYSIGMSQRREVEQVQFAEDSLQLRQDIPAGMRLEMLLSAPMHADELRARALLLMAAFLGRHYRYEASIEVCNALLDENRLAVPSQVTVKLMRVVAMLHLDYLYDADRAINELRKLVDRSDLPADLTSSAMLRWVEIFRDVKTGHNREAIDQFNASRDLIRDALGHRAGEVYALVAVAHDRLGEAEPAARLFKDATALWPLNELLTRYEIVRPLGERYSPTYAPAIGGIVA